MGLSTGFFGQTVKYFPCLVPDGSLQSSTAAHSALSPLFTFGNIQGTKKLLTLRDVQFNSAQGMNLQLYADGFQPAPLDAAAGALLVTNDPTAYDGWNAPAASRLQLSYQNTTGSAITNWWSSWGVLAEVPTYAQRLKFPLYLPRLSPQEQAMADKLGLTGPDPRGVLPRTFEWIVENEFRTQITAAAKFGQTMSVTSAGANFFTDLPRDNEILVMRAFMGSAGSGSDGLAWVFNVDENQTWLQFSAYAPAQGVPLSLFIISTQQITVSAVSTSTVANVSACATIWHVRKTDEIKARIGEEADPVAATKVAAGVL